MEQYLTITKIQNKDFHNTTMKKNLKQYFKEAIIPHDRLDKLK